MRGAPTAIFSVVNGIVLRPLPSTEPERLATVMTFWTTRGVRGTTVSAPDFHDWRAQNRSFEEMAFAISPTDSGVLTGVTALVATTALAACYVPGRRALRVDPTSALRAE